MASSIDPKSTPVAERSNGSDYLLADESGIRKPPRPSMAWEREPDPTPSNGVMAAGAAASANRSDNPFRKHSDSEKKALYGFMRFRDPAIGAVVSREEGMKRNPKPEFYEPARRGSEPEVYKQGGAWQSTHDPPRVTPDAGAARRASFPDLTGTPSDSVSVSELMEGFQRLLSKINSDTTLGDGPVKPTIMLGNRVVKTPSFNVPKNTIADRIKAISEYRTGLKVFFEGTLVPDGPELIKPILDECDARYQKWLEAGESSDDSEGQMDSPAEESTPDTEEATAWLCELDGGQEKDRVCVPTVVTSDTVRFYLRRLFPLVKAELPVEIQEDLADDGGIDYWEKFVDFMMLLRVRHDIQDAEEWDQASELVKTGLGPLNGEAVLNQMRRWGFYLRHFKSLRDVTLEGEMRGIRAIAVVIRGIVKDEDDRFELTAITPGSNSKAFAPRRKDLDSFMMELVKFAKGRRICPQPSKPGTGGGNGERCKMFALGKCRFGARCKHRHDPVTANLGDAEQETDGEPTDPDGSVGVVTDPGDLRDALAPIAQKKGGGGDGPKGHCKLWRRTGKCTYEANCKFQHDPSKASETKGQVCKLLLAGRCKFSQDSCLFEHDGSPRRVQAKEKAKGTGKGKGMAAMFLKSADGYHSEVVDVDLEACILELENTPIPVTALKSKAKIPKFQGRMYWIGDTAANAPILGEEDGVRVIKINHGRQASLVGVDGECVEKKTIILADTPLGREVGLLSPGSDPLFPVLTMARKRNVGFAIAKGAKSFEMEGVNDEWDRIIDNDIPYFVHKTAMMGEAATVERPIRNKGAVAEVPAINILRMEAQRIWEAVDEFDVLRVSVNVGPSALRAAYQRVKAEVSLPDDFYDEDPDGDIWEISDAAVTYVDGCFVEALWKVEQAFDEAWDDQYKEVWRILKAKGRWEVMDVTKETDPGSLKKRFYRLSLLTHPDKCGDDETKDDFTAAFAMLTDAYSFFQEHGLKGESEEDVPEESPSKAWLDEMRKRAEEGATTPRRAPPIISAELDGGTRAFIRSMQDCALQRLRGNLTLIEKMRVNVEVERKDLFKLLDRANHQVLLVLTASVIGRATIPHAGQLSLGSEIAGIVEEEYGDKILEAKTASDLKLERFVHTKLAVNQEYALAQECEDVLARDAKRRAAIKEKNKTLPPEEQVSLDVLRTKIVRQCDNEGARQIHQGQAWREVQWRQRTRKLEQEGRDKLIRVARLILDKGITASGLVPGLGDLLWSRWMLGRIAPSFDWRFVKSEDIDGGMWRSYCSNEQEFRRDIAAEEKTKFLSLANTTPTTGKRRGHGDRDSNKKRKTTQDGKFIQIQNSPSSEEPAPASTRPAQEEVIQRIRVPGKYMPGEEFEYKSVDLDKAIEEHEEEEDPCACLLREESIEMSLGVWTNKTPDIDEDDFTLNGKTPAEVKDPVLIVPSTSKVVMAM